MTENKEGTSSEYASVSSDPDYVEQPASLFGNLRTRLQWQPSAKTMHCQCGSHSYPRHSHCVLWLR